MNDYIDLSLRRLGGFKQRLDAHEAEARELIERGKRAGLDVSRMTLVEACAALSDQELAS